MKKNIWFPVENRAGVYVGQYVVPNFISNSIAIKVTEQEWVVVSPGATLLEQWSELCPDEGIQLSIIMPNSYHFMGVEAWLERFPNAKLYASKKAIKRLNKQGLPAITALEDQAPNLPDHFHILIPPGHRGGDVWLSQNNSEKGALWITCDSFQNYERYSNQPIARTLQKLMDTAPGLKMSQFVKWLLMDNKRRFKHWVLDQIQEDKPTTLIPSHGEVEHDEQLSQRISELVKARL